MTDPQGLRRRYFLYELILTAGLLAVPFAFFAGFFGPQFLLLVPAWAAGFLVSWKMEGREDSLVRQLPAALGIIGAGVWLVFAMARASDYGEMALVCVEGIFICSAALSFFVSSTRSLTLLQYLSLTAFIGHAFFYPDYTVGILVLIAVYGVLWLCLFRLKFHALALSPQRLLLRPDGALVLAGALALASWFAAVLVTSGVAARVINSSQAQKWQGTKAKLAAAQRGYFEQVEQFQSKMALRLPEFSTQAQRQDGLMYLSEVTSGTSSAFESQNAEEGLVSLLNNPGPGLAPKMEDEGLTLSTRNFMGVKTQYKMDQSFKQAASEMKQQPLPQRVSSLDALNSLKDAATAKEAAFQEARLKEKAEAARFSADSRDAAMKGIEGLAEWKTMDLYRRQMASLSAAFDELTGSDRGQLNAVLSSLRQAKDLKEIREASQGLSSRGREAVELKLKLLEYSQLSSLEQGLAGQSGLGEYTRRSLTEALEQSVKKDDLRAQSDRLSGLFTKVSDSAPALVPAVQGLIGTEVYLGEEKIKADIAGVIAKSALPDHGKNFMNELVKAAELEPQQGLATVDQLIRQAAKLKANGFMRSREYGEALERLQELKSLLELRIKASVEMEPVTEPLREARPEEPVFAPDQLLSIVITPESLRLTKGDGFSLKAEAIYGDSSRKDVTARALWEVSDPRVLSISQGGKGQALRKGSATAWASSLGVRSLDTEVVVVPVPLDLGSIVGKSAALLIALAFAALAALLVRQGSARRALSAGSNEPNLFIQALYANLLKILMLLGPRSAGQLPPRMRARDAREGLGIGADIDRLTECYEEARYSGRQMGQSHADSARMLYANIVTDIWKGLKTSRKAGLFFAGLIKGVPVRL